MAISEEIMLIQTVAGVNSNKFYHVILDDAGVLTKRWGRVGATGQTKVETTGRAGYDKIVREKMRGGYKRVDVVGSSSVNGPAGRTADRAVLQQAASTQLAAVAGDPKIQRLLDILVSANSHQIVATSGGVMTVDDSGLVRTPLGLIGAGSLSQAQQVLNQYNQLQTETDRVRAVEEYLQLVPQKVSRKAGWASTFLDSPTKVSDQEELLRQLRSSLALAQTRQGDAVKKITDDDDKFAGLFSYARLAPSDDRKARAAVEKMYSASRNRHHQSANLKLADIYELQYPDTFEGDFRTLAGELGNLREFWHGTQTGNLLSILKEGLYIPRTASHGRMFGNGVYFSDQSTKSLNYSSGYWSGNRGGAAGQCFMFVAEVIMGNAFLSREHRSLQRTTAVREAFQGKDPQGKPWNSLVVNGGDYGVTNNEMIVWNKKQIRLKYLCEFKA